MQFVLDKIMKTPTSSIGHKIEHLFIILLFCLNMVLSYYLHDFLSPFSILLGLVSFIMAIGLSIQFIFETIYQPKK